MKTRLITAVIFVFGLAGLTACANTDTETTSPDDGDTMRSSGIALTSDTLADTDVAHMQFDITGVDCDTGNPTGFTDQKTKDLSDMMLPGGISKFEPGSDNADPALAKLDKDSKHLFADAFFLVDAGCYDVVTTPLDNAGTPSEDCRQATADRVPVEDGQTEEILLINQCKGVERGGLDVISAINHPPEVSNLNFQKFRASCPTVGQEPQVCVTAEDPDNDPLAFEWSAVGGEFQGDIVEATRNQRADGTWQSCARVATNRIGDYQFEVSIFDLDGDGQRMETVLQQQEGQEILSRDSISFPIYSGANCQGRRATVLMAIGDNLGVEGPNAMQKAEQLIKQTANWASPRFDKPTTDVLYILDDNNHGEHLPQDRENVTDALDSIYSNVDEMVEPSTGITSDDLDGYDLVWFAGVGWPMDEVNTRDALRQFSEQGGGVVLEGNDMGRHAADDEGLEFFTGLEFLNNGTTTCGDTTDNYSGNTYKVEFSQEAHPSIDGLLGESIEYDNDIDHVRRNLDADAVPGRSIATARYSSGDCTYQGPAATVISPLDLPN